MQHLFKAPKGATPTSIAARVCKAVPKRQFTVKIEGQQGILIPELPAKAPKWSRAELAALNRALPRWSQEEAEAAARKKKAGKKKKAAKAAKAVKKPAAGKKKLTRAQRDARRRKAKAAKAKAEKKKTK